MDVLMPQLGETVAEGKISKWFVAAGDAVKPGDNLFEIETDKVSMEVPAISAGVLEEIRVPAGEVAPVGAIVAIIADGASATASPQAAVTGAPPKAPAAPAHAPMPATRTATSDASRPATARSAPLDPFFEVRTPERNYGPARPSSGAVAPPLARRLAGAGRIDLDRVAGPGPPGRIVARHVEQQRGQAPAAPAAIPLGPYRAAAQARCA